jgi:hypothetical protein
VLEEHEIGWSHAGCEENHKDFHVAGYRARRSKVPISTSQKKHPPKEAVKCRVRLVQLRQHYLLKSRILSESSHSAPAIGMTLPSLASWSPPLQVQKTGLSQPILCEIPSQ